MFLGNPPWDTLSPDVKEFFSAFDPDVRFQDRTGQDAIVAKLLEDPVIAARWEDHRRQLYTEVHFYKDSGIYVLFAPGNLGKGDFNIYRMFVELALGKVGHNGRACQVVPSGLYNGANCAAIREFLLNETCLESMFGFSNTSQVWFKGINVTTRFCIYTARVPGKTSALKAAFAIDTQEKLRAVSAGSTLSLPAHLIRTFSPDALSILELNSQLDISVAEKMYSRYPGFGNKSSGPPRRQYMRELDMGNDRELFCAEQNGLPIYEGRMVSQYDHRAKGYRAGRGRSADWEELPFSDLEKSVQPQWWIQIDRIPSKLRNRLNKYRIGFCDVAYPDTERSFISAILPSGCVAGHKVPTITFEDGSEWIYLVWLSVANSFSMDWLVRKQIKLTVSYTIVDSLPFPHPRLGDHAVGLLCPLALRLSCTGPEMIDYWNQMAKYGWAAPVPEGTTPPGYFDDEDRLLARAKIESIVARDLYGITKDELSYILDTFPIVERRDRQRYGDYRTKLLVLEMYDRLEQGLDLGIPAPAKPPPTQSPALAAQRLQPAPFPEPTRKPLQAHFELTPPPPRPTRPGPVSPGAAAAPPAPTRPTAAAPLTQALDYLKTHPGPRSRADLMGALEIDASDWITLARQLAEHEDVEKTGEKRGTRYAWKAP
ncbi:MAG: hypothetical protein HY900_36075 [Deltaproteobacteria bacterium]|nr:hypothetical protein [Deltaproteobacteria bacterium]